MDRILASQAAPVHTRQLTALPTDETQATTPHTTRRVLTATHHAYFPASSPIPDVTSGTYSSSSSGFRAMQTSSGKPTLMGLTRVGNKNDTAIQNNLNQMYDFERVIL